MSSSTDAESSDTTVEIKIRALDSSSYSVRVNKDIPVPALKEQLQSLVGVPAQEQRLIYRGKVLKDDQLLSAYNVEDGHTLHLVPRPLQAPQAQQAQQTQGDPSNASEGRPAQVTTSLLVGTINVPTVGDGSLPDFNRIVSAVLGQVGNISGTNIPGTNAQGANVPAPADGGQPRPGAQPAGVYQPMPRPIEVSSDALTTLSLYINRMEQMFVNTGLVPPLQPPPPPAPDAAPRTNRPMSPAVLGSVILRALSLLNEQAAPILSGLAGQFENEASITDAVMRSEVQAAAVWNGTVLQQLGALLMELGRATLTLRMGSTPDESFVNSGPALFISPSGANPILVQPTPFQPLGSLSSRPAWPGTATGLGPSGPRSLNIHIHTSDVGLSPAPGAQEQAPGGAPGAAQTPVNFQDGTAQAIVQETIMVFQDNGDARLLSSRSRSLNPEGDSQQQTQAQAQPGLNPGEGVAGAQGGSTPQMNHVAQALNQLWPGLGSLRTQSSTQQQQQQHQASSQQQPGGSFASLNLGPGSLSSLLGQLAPGLQGSAMPQGFTFTSQPQQTQPAQQPSVPSVPSVPTPQQVSVSVPTPATPAQSHEQPAADSGNEASSSSESKPKEEQKEIKEKRVAGSQTSAPAGLGSLRPLVPRRRQETTGDSSSRSQAGLASQTSSGENILANVMGGLLGSNSGGGGDFRRVLQQALPVVSQLLAGGLAQQQTSSGDRSNSEVNGTSNNLVTSTEIQNSGEVLQKLEGDATPEDVLRTVADAALENSELSLSNTDVEEMVSGLANDYLELLVRDLNSRQRE